MVTIALPVNEGVGHVVVVIGFDPTTNELIFYNPALGVKQPESELVKMYGSSRGINTFADLWAASNQFIPSNAMVTDQKLR